MNINIDELFVLLTKKSGSIVTYKALSENLGISYFTLRERLRNKREFTAADLWVFKKHYNLTNDEIASIFIDRE